MSLSGNQGEKEVTHEQIKESPQIKEVIRGVYTKKNLWHFLKTVHCTNKYNYAIWDDCCTQEQDVTHTIVGSHHSCDIILLLRTRMQKATIVISLKSLSLIPCGTLQKSWISPMQTWNLEVKTPFSHSLWDTEESWISPVQTWNLEVKTPKQCRCHLVPHFEEWESWL
jgi:hypothetical protein